MKGLLFRKS